uniref:Uncharacterized protein n=1 Tax=Rhizophora mucronata TaxID=61149 RepID=A0A2P2QQC5_RHIMU
MVIGVVMSLDVCNSTQNNRSQTNCIQ